MAQRETTVLTGPVSEYIWSLKDGHGLETRSYQHEGAPRPSDLGVAAIFDPDPAGWIDVAVVRARLRDALVDAADDAEFRVTLQKRKGSSSARSAEDVLLIGQVIWNLVTSPGDGRLVLPEPREGMRLPAYLGKGPDIARMGRDQRFRIEDSRDSKLKGRQCRSEVGGGDSLKENGKKLSNRMADFLIAEYRPPKPVDVGRPEILSAVPRVSAVEVKLGAARDGPRGRSLRTLAPDYLSVGAESGIGDVLLDSSILEFDGTDLANVEIVGMGTIDDWPDHPAVVKDARARIAVPEPNHAKAHLVGWQPPVNDQGNKVVLEVAKSDYWTSLATRDQVSELQDLIVSGNVPLDRLPRRLDVHLVVVAGEDDHVLLTRRGRYVATEPETWMVTVGESVDWDEDIAGVAPHPLRTAKRCLAERDELNLPVELLEQSLFTLLGIATEWNEMLANLIVLVNVPGLSINSARRVFRKGENVAIDAVPFTVEACTPLIERGFYAAAGSLSTQRVSDISRIALNAAVVNRFGSSALR